MTGHLSLLSRVDLATRLRGSEATLRRRLTRAEVLVELGRAVHQSAEPAQATGDLQKSLGLPDIPTVAALKVPLHGRSALVALDSAPAARTPRFGVTTTRLLARMLEPAGLALENAQRAQRAVTPSVTDDLTQLCNSRSAALVEAAAIIRGSARETDEVLLQVADLAMYRVKDRGKNGISVAPPFERRTADADRVSAAGGKQ